MVEVGDFISEADVQLIKENIELHCCSSTFSDLPPGSLDAVLTDPPYYANVQYAELMDFCYVWLRRL
ncbi:MAG: hypothetical protein M1119_07520 [Firmicutes bacterium]|nr:hypothetical protein [Bacillota bacterium]